MGFKLPFTRNLGPRETYPGRELDGRSEALTASLQFLAFENMAMAAAAGITVAQSDDVEDSRNRHYTGNPYPTYQRRMKQLLDMYEGKARWGCDTARVVVDVRAAFIIGQGVQPTFDAEERISSRERAFIKDFISYNNLDEQLPLQYAQQGEIEGKWLTLLEWDPVRRMVRARYKPYSQFPYNLEVSESDASEYIRVWYNGTGTTSFDARPDRFVYARFGGSARQAAETPTKATMVLRDMEDMDKAMWDWRKINHLYASPTPVFRFRDPATAKQFTDANLSGDNNWRIGKGIALGGEGADFTLECYKGEGYTTVKDEVLYHMRKINGATGVPPHFFGHPDLLSNRDTADNMIEGVILSTRTERKTWVGAYQQLFRKAAQLYNTGMRTDLNPNIINAEIKEVSSAKINEIAKVWLPAFEAGAIDLELILRHLPDNSIDETDVRRIRDAMQRKEQADRNAQNARERTDAAVSQS